MRRVSVIPSAAAKKSLALPYGVLPLLAAYRNTVHGCKVQQYRHGKQVVELGETAVNMLQREIARLAAISASAVTPRTLSRARETRALLHTIHKLLEEIRCFDSVSFGGAFAAQLHDMKFFRRVARRAHATEESNVAGTGASMQELLRVVREEISGELGCAPTDVPLDEPADALEFSRLSGLPLTVIRSSASEIEPWLFLPTYVGTDLVSVSQLYNAPGGEDGRTTSGRARDALGGSNGLLLLNPSDSAVAKLAVAWTVTGNPYLSLPAQPMAVLCCTLWSLVESAFKVCRLKSPDRAKVESLLRSAMDVAERVTARVETWAWGRDLNARLTTISKEGPFAAPFTESHGALSICMVLSALLRCDGAAVLASPAYSRIALAMLGEAVSRSCRVCLRSTGKTANTFIRGALKKHPQKGVQLRAIEDIDMVESTR
jgi:hypothetical protein